MTPPSLSVAREILASESASIRSAYDAYPHKVHEFAAAIDVVLARIATCEAPAAPPADERSPVNVPLLDDESRPIGMATVSADGSVRVVAQFHNEGVARSLRGSSLRPVEARMGPFSMGYVPDRREGAAPAKGCSEHACIRHPLCLAATKLCGCPECQRALAAASTVRVGYVDGAGVWHDGDPPGWLSTAYTAPGTPAASTPGARVRVTTGEYAGFVGNVLPRAGDDPQGWSRVRREGGWQETRLFPSESLAPA